VVLDGTRAVGVIIEAEVTHSREQVDGERVTLAGGSIGTLAILLRSGIGPADEARRVGIVPAVELPGVGANLIDHAQVAIHLTTRSVPPEDPPWGQAVLWCIASGSAEPNDLQRFSS
jgi:choline dehydrogenase